MSPYELAKTIKNETALKAFPTASNKLKDTIYVPELANIETTSRSKSICNT